MKILMVCLGNICRSPLAHGILQHQAQEQGIAIEVDSAGTSDYHKNQAPDPRSISVAKKYGIDISSQRSRQITLEDLDYYDHIYVMDSSNYQNVLKLCSKDEQRNKVEFMMNCLEPKHNVNVPDPYWDDQGFEKVYKMLNRACRSLVAELNA